MESFIRRKYEFRQFMVDGGDPPRSTARPESNGTRAVSFSTNANLPQRPGMGAQKPGRSASASVTTSTPPHPSPYASQQFSSPMIMVDNFDPQPIALRQADTFIPAPPLQTYANNPFRRQSQPAYLDKNAILSLYEQGYQTPKAAPVATHANTAEESEQVLISHSPESFNDPFASWQDAPTHRRDREASLNAFSSLAAWST